MLTNIYGISGLDYSIVKNAFPMLDDSVKARIKEAESLGDASLNSVLLSYRSHILRILGLGGEETDTVDGIVYDAVTAYLGRPCDAHTAKEAVKAAEGTSPEAFYLWVKSQYKPVDALAQLYEKLGAGTVPLALSIMRAPEGVPISLHLVKARDVNVSDAPELPEDFMTKYPDLLDSTDVQDAIVEAYIRAGLSLLFNGDTVKSECDKFRSRGLLRYFPLMVWELAGHSYSQVEETIFAEG